MLVKYVHWGLIDKLRQKNMKDSTHEALRIKCRPIMKRKDKTSNNVASSSTEWNPNS